MSIINSDRACSFQFSELPHGVLEQQLIPKLTTQSKYALAMLNRATHARFLKYYYEYCKAKERCNYLTEGAFAYPKPDLIHSLNFSMRIKFNDESLQGVVKTFPRLRSLNLSQTAITDKALPLLLRLTELNELDLSQCYHLNIIDSALNSFTRLKALNVSNVKIKHPLLLSDLIHLQSLRIHSIQFKSNFPILAIGVALKVLNISCTDTEQLPSSYDLNQLESLDASCCPLNQSAFDRLAELTCLKNLDLSGVDLRAVSESSLKQLSKLTVLEKFNFPWAFQRGRLPTTPNLVEIDLPDRIDVSILPSISKNYPDLRRLKLSNCPSTNVLEKCCEQLPYLHSLSLSDVNITNAFVETLAKLPLLERLSLLDSYISPEQLSTLLSSQTIVYLHITMGHGIDREYKKKIDAEQLKSQRLFALELEARWISEIDPFPIENLTNQASATTSTLERNEMCL